MRLLPPLLRNVFYAYLVSGCQLVYSLFANLVIPAVASKSDYANYRILVLYAGFAGVLHFGLLNGLYLKVIGRSVEETNPPLLRKVRATLFALQACLLPISYFVLRRVLTAKIHGFVIFAIVVSWGLANWITFHNYYFQGTNHFGRFALANSISFMAGIIILLVMTLAKSTSALYLEISFITQLLVTILVYEVLWAKRIKPKLTSGPSWNPGDEKHVLSHVWRRGFLLYLANLGIVGVFSLGGLAASLLFTPSQFAEYAFAFGFTSIVYISFDGLMSVLIPFLARSGADRKRSMASEVSIISLMWLSPLVYWIGLIIVPRWFPHYKAALPLIFVFTISLPFAAVIRSRIIPTSTAQGREKLLLTFSMGSFMTAALVIGAFCLGAPSLPKIAAAWVLAIVISAMVGGGYVARCLGGEKKADLRIIANAVVAGLLFILIGRSGASAPYSFAYLCCAMFAVLFCWRGTGRRYGALKDAYLK